MGLCSPQKLLALVGNVCAERCGLKPVWRLLTWRDGADFVFVSVVEFRLFRTLWITVCHADAPSVRNDVVLIKAPFSDALIVSASTSRSCFYVIQYKEH